MLQIKTNFYFLIFLLGIWTYSNAESVKWLLEDAFEKEYVPLREMVYTMPSEVKDALSAYEKEEFYRSILILEKVRKLRLPDDRQDFITFLLAESYRGLNVADQASNDYRYVINNFPKSDLVAPSFFRLLEFAATNENVETVDSIQQVFQSRFRHHPLNNSVLYTCGKLYYKVRRFGEATQLLSQINKNSIRYQQAQFLAALCYVQMKDWQKALTLLELVRNNTRDLQVSSEADIVMGDIYYGQKDIPKAIKAYKDVDKGAKRYRYALVKLARGYFDIGKYDIAAQLSRDFIKQDTQSEYFFEMASILEQCYAKMGKENESQKINTLIHQQISRARVAFEIYEELDKVTDLKKGWQVLEYEGLLKGKRNLKDAAGAALKRVRNLETSYNNILNKIGARDSKGKNEVPHLAERRYLSLLKKEIALLDDSLTILKSNLEKAASKARDARDTNIIKSVDSLADLMDQKRSERSKWEHEYAVVIRDCLGGEYEGRQAEEEMQAKFVDWAFMKYQEKKKDLIKINIDLANKKKQELKKDSTTNKNKQDIIQAFSENDKNKLIKVISEDRSKIIDHISTMLEVYPKNKYNPPLLFRLAELQFDYAEEEFQSRLRVYEQKIKENKDTAGLTFPEYKLTKTIETYDKIIEQFTKSEFADDAIYYKALALQKEGSESEANVALLELIEKYPESEYFVEANMNIGRYYFEHPKAEEGQGYKLAEEAYRKVLFYRDHPQFVQALYHMGWCYYMQDRFDDAIAVFKYLIEEANLDFDPSKADEKEVANPLLRGEAIDYIAISFDEEKKIEDAVKFLKMIGNDDYAAMVLNRIGELREEDLDISAASSIYKRVLQEYPKASSAPDVAANLIKLYDTKDKGDSSLIIREQFFETYSKKGEWQEEAGKKDSMSLGRVDSMAISIGLYVADASYKQAENSKRTDDYSRAAKNYRKLVDKYPKDIKAAEARWNLAVILDTKLNDKAQSYSEYLKFSHFEQLDINRREQAALNAVAIAQSLLPPDTAIQSGVIDFAANKAIEAVDNYTVYFPKGKSYAAVLLNKGAIYFNRQLYTKAIDVYNEIIKLGQTQKEYNEALLYLGQCYFGQENWTGASKIFERVWKETTDQERKNAAYRMLLQSDFLYAKKLMTQGDYENASAVFRSIDDKYPGSEYGDVTLFNAAEALEKKELWIKAAEGYYELYRRYPQSKFTGDALFNAAEDYEKGDKYLKAAETYELISSQFPTSPKAKDALFNLGFCYEKLNKLDKMAEVNERYSQLYPNEKDVEVMLLRSGNYFSRAGMHERAISVYKNFIRRFPNSSKCVEAQFSIAKSQFDLNDKENALKGFSDAELIHNKLVSAGGEGNVYWASEAAFFSAMARREKFLQIKLVLPDANLKTAAKTKSELLTEAVKAFQRVMLYKSEKLFEAAYRVGQLYEDMALAWKDQERPKLDPIKQAVLEKEILTVSAGLLQKTFVPYGKAIELSRELDSLKSDQKIWVEKASTSLLHNYLASGEFQLDAVTAMADAPVPKEIREKPLHYFQYQKQLLETLEPLKVQVRQYYYNSVNIIDSLRLSSDASEKCRQEFAHICYLVPNGYEVLASQILKSGQNLPKNMSENEKEDLLFQMEDIVFELQDKAIFGYEDALKKLNANSLQSSLWFNKVMESLARLSPDKYGAAVFSTHTFSTDRSWLSRQDSVGKWNSKEVTLDGWNLSSIINSETVTIGNVRTSWIWDSSKTTQHLYLWKNVFLNGIPRNASVYVASQSKYKMYINGSLVLSDTIGNRNKEKVDSAVGINSLVAGGDNILALEAVAVDSIQPGIAVSFLAMLDTSQHFVSSIKAPAILSQIAANEDKKVGTGQKVSGSSKERDKQALNEPASKFKNQKEIIKAINWYAKRENDINQQIKQERLDIQRIRIEQEELETKIKLVKEETANLKAIYEKEYAPKPAKPKETSQ